MDFKSFSSESRNSCFLIGCVYFRLRFLFVQTVSVNMIIELIYYHIKPVAVNFFLISAWPPPSLPRIFYNVMCEIIVIVIPFHKYFFPYWNFVYIKSLIGGGNLYLHSAHSSFSFTPLCSVFISLIFCKFNGFKWREVQFLSRCYECTSKRMASEGFYLCKDLCPVLVRFSLEYWILIL